jgi:hypothetical protein
VIRRLRRLHRFWVLALALPGAVLLVLGLLARRPADRFRVRHDLLRGLEAQTQPPAPSPPADPARPGGRP